MTGFRSANVQPLTLMAERLSDALARECISDRWEDRHESDRHSLLAICEWLLMDWSLLESARLSHIKGNLGEDHLSPLHRGSRMLREKSNENAD